MGKRTRLPVVFVQSNEKTTGNGVPLPMPPNLYSISVVAARPTASWR